MSGYPVLLDGAAIDALIAGGGAVAARKARVLLSAGARVRVVAPDICAALRAMDTPGSRLRLVSRAVTAADVADATLVIAATDDPAVNGMLAGEARARGRPVNVVDEPGRGTFVTLAVHRAGEVTVAVSAGGVPGAARRIRDAIAERVDGRYGAAVAVVAELRARLLARGDRAGWERAASALLGEDFCARVEDATLVTEVSRWD